MEKIPGNISIEELQKISLLGTAHILSKVASPVAPKETGSFSVHWDVIIKIIIIIIIIIIVKLLGTLDNTRSYKL